MSVWRIFSGLILAGVIAVVCGGLIWHHYHQPTPPGNHAGAATGKPITPTPTGTNTGTQPKVPKPSEAQLKLGFVAKHSGGSPWKAIAKQLRADPKTWGYAGDPNDKKTLTTWVNREATVDIIRNGKYYHGVGDEVRTYGDVSYVLQKDPATGKTQIAEYVPSPTYNARINPLMKINGFGIAVSLVATNTLAPSIATSHFTGVSATTGEKLPVPSYEYVYEPHA